MQKLNGNVLKVEEEKTEREPIRVVTDKAVIKKESSLAKKIFVQDLKTTSKNVLNDTIIPGIKRLFSDMIKRGTDLIFYGTYTGSNNGYVNYNGISGTRSVSVTPMSTISRPQSSPVSSMPSIYQVNNVEFINSELAWEVLDEMKMYLGRNGMISVAEFYSAASQPFNHTDWKFGWTDLSTATVETLYNGRAHVILPKPIILEK